jgi:hypothetical protein
MKFWKHTLITALAFFGVASIVLYSSCTDDSCTRLKCRNGGTCIDGFCKCPSGYEGQQCETAVSDKFIGRYYGNTKCSGVPQDIIDSAVVFHSNGPDRIGIFRFAVPDTFYATVTSTGLVNPDASANNGANVTITLENDRIGLHAAKSDGTVCDFIGTR